MAASITARFLGRGFGVLEDLLVIHWRMVAPRMSNAHQSSTALVVKPVELHMVAIRHRDYVIHALLIAEVPVVQKRAVGFFRTA
jgi:hypothetical protein